MQDGVDRIYAGTSHDHGKYSTIVPWSCGHKHWTPVQHIELDKHWNDNSSIRSDLRVNPRWRKLMYDNYESRKQT